MTDQPPPPVSQPPYKAGNAFTWAANKFKKNAAAVMVPTLVYGVVAACLSLGIQFLAARVAPDTVSVHASDRLDAYDEFKSYISSPSGIVTILGTFVLVIVLGAMASGYFGGMLDIANERRVTIGSFFKPRNVGNVIVASLIVYVLIWIGSAVCGIGGVIVGIFSMFTIVALLDRNLPPIDAVKTSFRITKANFGKVLRAVLLAVLILFAVAVVVTLALVAVVALIDNLGVFWFLYGVPTAVGLLVAIPLLALVLVYTYRNLTGGQVAPLTTP